VVHRIRGTYPWPGGKAVFHRLDGSQLRLTVAQAQRAEGEAQDAPGVLDADLHIATGAGRIDLLEVKPDGKRLMSWQDFCNGYRVRQGGRFDSPGMSA
jgi:methionyl-tRNA formyltransferase